jgi:hypothetical protein
MELQLLVRERLASATELSGAPKTSPNAPLHVSHKSPALHVRGKRFQGKINPTQTTLHLMGTERGPPKPHPQSS